MWLVRGTAATILFAVLLPVGPILEARQRTIRCESRGNRETFCRAPTDGRVSLVRELSRNRCRQWRTWGFERRGVWVRDGCRADFRVGRSSGVVRGGGIGPGTAAVIGAGVGAAVTAAILAGRDNTPARRPPSWAVGSFRGFDPRDDIELDITVDARGNVTGTADERTIGGRITDGGIRIGTADFAMTRQPWGFTARQRDGSNTTVYFRRLDGS